YTTDEKGHGRASLPRDPLLPDPTPAPSPLRRLRSIMQPFPPVPVVHEPRDAIDAVKGGRSARIRLRGEARPQTHRPWFVSPRLRRNAVRGATCGAQYATCEWTRSRRHPPCTPFLKAVRLLAGDGAGTLL